jgi:hypothetical protein
MSIENQEQRIRTFINSTRRQSVLLGNSADWNKLCSSLDLIGDTELAIGAYPNLCLHGNDHGSSYLLVYGILQTLLLQQDAAKHIGTALNIKVNLPKELTDIRIIRNGAAGHPGFQRESGQSKSCFISRMSLSATSFELMTAYSDEGSFKMSHVNIPKLLKTQKIYLSKVLSEVITQLESQEKEHREMHKETKLSACFPRTISYYFGKIFEATMTAEKYSLGKMHLELIKGCLDDFKQKLEARGEWQIYDSVNYHYEQLSYPISELSLYFDSSSESELNSKDAYIFTSFLVEHFKSLSGIAKEIDEEYDSEP